MACSVMAVEDADLDTTKVDGDRFGVLIGSGIGGIQTLLSTHDTLREKGPDRVSPFFIPMMIVNMASGLVSMRFGAKGPNSSVITACATGNHAIGDALRLIQRGDADVMIAGGAEAIIIPLTIAGFCAMKRSEEHTSELQSLAYLVCRLLLEKKKNRISPGTQVGRRAICISSLRSTRR